MVKMGSLFSKSKHTSRVTAQDKAILQLKQQRDKLKQYQKRVELSLERDREVARTLLRDGKKDRARLLLRKKKYQEQLIAKTDTQLENLEQLAQDIEFAQVELEVVNGLKVGNEALKKVHEVLNINEVEKIMEETREGIEKQRELDALLCGSLSQEDEEAVLEELDEIIKASLPAVPADEVPQPEPELPDVPAEELKAKKSKKVAVEA